MTPTEPDRRTRPTRRRAAALVVSSLLVSLVIAAYLVPKTSSFRRWVVAKEAAVARYGDPEIEALPSMIWAHRGLRSDVAPPNTAASMRAAAEAGYAGVEMDLRWRDGALVVAHDEDERGLPFSEVVAGVGPTQYLWLDFKSLSASVARESAPALSRELPEGLRSRTFIESKSLAALAIFRAAVPGVRSIYTTSPWHRTRFSLGYASLLHDIEQHHISNVGVPARDLTPEFASALRGVGIFTWTTDDEDRLDRQLAWSVDVILTNGMPPTR